MIKVIDMSSWFELNKDTEAQFNFSLKNDDGETILTNTQPYISKGSAKADIEAVQRNCAYIDRYDTKESPAGEHYFNLQSPNHHIIATSPMYQTAESRDTAINSVISSGSTRVIKS